MEQSEPNRIDKWKAVWEAENISFHKLVPNETLVKYYGKLTNGKKGLKFYLPLCGKSVDMKWLSDHGQDVIGTECVEMACKQFFQEQNLRYSESSDIPGTADGKLFMASSGKLRIFQCDVLAIESSVIGKVDVVWDRGSLVVIDIPDRKAYIEGLKDVTGPETAILLETFEYDLDERTTERAPSPLFRKDIDALFGDWCSISEEERSDCLDAQPHFRQWGLTWMTNVVYLMKPKS